MTDHYREAEERLRASDWQRQEGHLDTAMHEAAVAQVHATLALVADKRRENIPADIPAPSTTGGDLRERVSEAMHDKVCDCLNRGHGFALRSKDTFALTEAVMSVVSPVLGGLRAEVARYTETNRRLNETVNHLSDRNRNLDKSADLRAVTIRDLGVQVADLKVDVDRYRALSESQAGELADLRSRVVLLPEDWRDQIMSLPSLVDELFREIESWSSPDSGDSKDSAERFQSRREIESPDSGKIEPLAPRVWTSTDVEPDEVGLTLRGRRGIWRRCDNFWSLTNPPEGWHVNGYEWHDIRWDAPLTEVLPESTEGAGDA